MVDWTKTISPTHVHDPVLESNMKSKTTSTGKLTHPAVLLEEQTSPSASTQPPPALSVIDAAQAQWADKINQRLRDGLKAWIEAGKDLIAAKRELGHGGFGAMLKSGFLKIDQRTAERLMRVADNDALTKSTNWSNLPQSLHSLDKLAALDAPAIEQAIKAGEITSAMTIKDAGELVRSKLDAHPKKAPTAAAAAPADAVEPKSPPVAGDKSSAQAAPFDAQAFKASLTQFLEREYAKFPGGHAVEMQSAAAAACSEFFTSRTATPSQSTGQISSALHLDGTLEANDVVPPPIEAREASRDVKTAAAKSCVTTTASSLTGDAMPVFRKNYPMSDVDRNRLLQDLATLKSTEPASRDYHDTLRRVVDAGHYLAVAGSLDAFCVEILRREPAEVKSALEREQPDPKAKQPVQHAPAPVETGPSRKLSLKEKIALSKQALRATA